MHALPRSAPRWHGTIPLVAAVLSASLITTPARAQDSLSHVGLVFGTGGPGLLWQVNHRFALRPALSIGGGTTGGTATWTVGPSVSVLRTVATSGDAQAYFAPGLGYSHTSLASSSSSDRFSLWIDGGVRQRLGRRVSLYAELGPSFSEVHSHTNAPQLSITTVSQSWGIGSGIGVVWYFR